MKNKILIGTAVLAAATLVAYFVRRRRVNKGDLQAVSPRKSHHTTEVFAHAKNQAD